MCSSGPKMQAPPPPIRYAEQKTPTRRDTRDAQGRVKSMRKRATRTVLTRGVASAVDESGKKTLLGA